MSLLDKLKKLVEELENEDKASSEPNPTESLIQELQAKVDKLTSTVDTTVRTRILDTVPSHMREMVQHIPTDKLEDVIRSESFKKLASLTPVAEAESTDTTATPPTPPLGDPDGALSTSSDLTAENIASVLAGADLTA